MSRSGTKKQPYRKSRRFDKTCRCNGSCGYCMNNRLASTRRRKEAANAKSALQEG